MTPTDLETLRGLVKRGINRYDYLYWGGGEYEWRENNLNGEYCEFDNYRQLKEALTALLDDREKMVDEIQSLKDSLLAAEAEIDGFASMLDSAN